jgi:hypothetical protein
MQATADDVVATVAWQAGAKATTARARVTTVVAMTEPEDTVPDLRPADLQEVAVDETDEAERPLPLEAEPADVAENRAAVDEDPDERRPPAYDL